jgi:hypothetical protein
MFFSNSPFLCNTQRVYMQLVARFSSWGSGGCSGVCWLIFRERSRLLFLPWLRPPLFFPNPSFFAHVLRSSWVCWFCFGKRGCCNQGYWLAIFGESKSHSLLFAVFIPLLNAKGCLEGWIRLFLSLFWVILRLVMSYIILI